MNTDSFDLSFFPTTTGIAIGQRRDTRGVGFPELYPLDLKNTVITFDSDESSPKITEGLIENGAEYFLKITEKQEKLLKEIRDIFNGPLLINQAREIEKPQESLLLTRSITVAPAKLLKKTSLSKWVGLATGSLIKETIKQAEKETGEVSIQDVFYISNFFPDNSHVAEQAARAIWEIPKVPESFLYLLSIDFFYDISQIKNANFVGNCEMLKQMYSRIERYLKDKTKKAYKTIRRGSGNVSKTKESFVDLIFDVASGYLQDRIWEEEEEDRRHQRWLASSKEF